MGAAQTASEGHEARFAADELAQAESDALVEVAQWAAITRRQRWALLEAIDALAVGSIDAELDFKQARHFLLVATRNLLRALEMPRTPRSLRRLSGPLSAAATLRNIFEHFDRTRDQLAGVSPARKAVRTHLSQGGDPNAWTVSIVGRQVTVGGTLTLDELAVTLDAVDEELQRLADAAMTVEQLAAHLGISAERLLRWMRQRFHDQVPNDVDGWTPSAQQREAARRHWDR